MSIKTVSRKLFAAIALVGLTLVSCTENVDVSQQRRYDSEQAFAPFATNAAYQKVTVPGFVGNDAFVYMQWLEHGSGTASPAMTDYVRVHYRGYLLTSWAKDNTQGLFESNFDQEVVSPRLVSGTIPGFAAALQNMKVGDRVSVVIPWYLAYGSAAQGSIPSYSALRFELRLLAIDGNTTNG